MSPATGGSPSFQLVGADRIDSWCQFPRDSSVKILWLDHGFSASAGSAEYRSFELARSLADAGHEVTVICACDFMSSTGLAAPFRADRREGRVAGINIVEFNLAGDGQPVQHFRAWLRYLIAVTGHAAGGFDLTVATSESPGCAVAAILARLIRRTPMVYDARSIRSRLRRAVGLSGPVSQLSTSFFERYACRIADKVVVTGDHLAEAAGGFGVGRFDLEVVSPASSLPETDNVVATRLPEKFPRIRTGQFVAVYTGPLDVDRGLNTLLDAAALLKLRERKDIVLLFAGEGIRRDAIARDITVRKLANVVIAGLQGRQQLLPFLGHCDIGLQLLASDPEVHASAGPTEYADYLAAGLPVLINYPGWLAGLVAQHDCGVTIRPGDAAALADALEHAADHRETLAHLRTNAVKLRELQFNRVAHLRRFNSVVEAALQEASARAGQASKRAMDIVLAGLLFVLAGPLAAVIAVLVRAVHGRPILDRDMRPGLFGRPVELLRFRTLRHAYRSDGGLLSDEERKTSLGRFLEMTGLARLPRLWNVLRGDISFVGPRPLPMQELSQLSGDEFRRQFVRPGMFSWRSAETGNGITDDLWYVDNRTVGLDLKAILDSLRNAFRRTLRARSAPSTAFAHVEDRQRGDDRAAI